VILLPILGLLLVGFIVLLIVVPAAPAVKTLAKPVVTQATRSTPAQVALTVAPTTKPTVVPTTVPTVALPTPAPRKIPTQVAPTATTAAQAVTHGTPLIGGQFSDFYGKYGTPHNQDATNGETWFVSEQPFIMVGADPNTSGKTTQVTVVEEDQTTGNSWPNDQMLSYCMQFMPADATEFNTVDNIIDYHSSIGEIVVQLQTASCVISMAQS
jgi:hypothetical protein